jgi:hypothetical protein
MKRSILVIASIAIALGVSAAAQSAGNTPWVGLWHAELDGQPAVTLTLAEDTGALGGTVVFNIVSRGGGQPHVIASEPHVVLGPRIDGNTLAFQIKKLDGGLLSFAVELSSAGKAQIHCLNCGADAPVAELVRDQVRPE